MEQPLRRCLFSALWMVSAFATCCTAQIHISRTNAPQTQPSSVLQVSNEKDSGIYAINEPIRWKIVCTTQPAVRSVHYLLKSGDLKVMGAGDLQLKAGAAVLETKLDAPGTVLAEITSKGLKEASGKAAKSLAGAVVAPEQIAPSDPPPADFDAFWKAKLAEAAQVPLNPQLQQKPSDLPGVSYWKVTLDNVGSTHVQGQLARPVDGTKLPALLVVQYAGVYALSKGWATDYASHGWLALNIEAHDIPIDETALLYQKLRDGELKNYPQIGNDDREKSYFLRMFLGCYQAAQYLMQRPDWDGKTLVITGQSQGGMQALATAYLVPQFSGVVICVPAGCDMTGPLVDRAPGWPRWYYSTAGKDATKVIETSRYFDAVNFASKIHCPLLMGVGLIDETVPAAGAIAAFNQAQGQKSLIVMPRSTHTKSQDQYWDASRKWLTALEIGKPTTLPVIP